MRIRRAIAVTALIGGAAFLPWVPVAGAPGLALAQTMSAPEAGAGAPLKGVPIRLTDRRGRPIAVASLPPEAQAQVARVQQAAASLAAGAAPGERIRISVSCTYPPLSCTITVTF